MADLNQLLGEVDQKKSRIEASMKELLGKYEDLYREAQHLYVYERRASKSTEGLEDFRFVVGRIRRNRDIVGSMLRGMQGLAGMGKYKFIEEDIPEPPKPERKPRKAREAETIDEEALVTIAEESVGGQVDG